jgi:cytochrome c-type biogenesis protein CcmH
MEAMSRGEVWRKSLAMSIYNDNMSVFVLGGSLVLIVMALVAAASLRGGAKPSHAAPQNVYLDQLAELDRDKELGRIGEQEAASLRTEIARRLIAEDRLAPREGAALSGKLLPAVLALIIPAICIPVYLANGAPNMPDTPLAERLENAEQNVDTEALIAKVESHLSTNPADARGWELLAPIYMNLGRYRDSAAAFEQIIRLTDANAETYASHGEALFLANDGIVDAAASTSFLEALKRDPSHTKSLFYSAITLKQDGKRQESRAIFEQLLKVAPEGAPWRKQVERELAALAKAPVLTDEQLESGQAMSGAEQKEMIRGMVDGLEKRLTSNGNDIDGWLRLIRARTVLGESDRALLSLSQARKIFEADQAKLSSLESLAKEVGLQ